MLISYRTSAQLGSLLLSHTVFVLLSVNAKIAVESGKLEEVQALQHDDWIMGKPFKISQKLSSHNTQLWGWSFIVFGTVFFIGFFYAAVVSKLWGWSFLISLHCRYYCFLVPLSLPVLVVFIYFHWLSMKLFKHA
ncbi:hypothetical protein V2J09_023966 [Rumex salicifolius]